MESNTLLNILQLGIIGLLAFFAKRYVVLNDKRIEKAERETDEVKKNYIKRFESVHVKIEETKQELVEEIQKTQQGQQQYRYEQARATAVLETKIDAAAGYFKELRDDMKEMRQDIKHR